MPKFTIYCKNKILTFTRKEFVFQLPLGKKARRRGAEKIDYLGKMGSAPVSFKFGVLACK
jgi:hypothetical protein